MALAIAGAVMTTFEDMFAASFAPESEGRSTFMLIAGISPLITLCSLLYVMFVALMNGTTLDKINAKLDVVIRNTGGDGEQGSNKPKRGDIKNSDDEPDG